MARARSAPETAGVELSEYSRRDPNGWLAVFFLAGLQLALLLAVSGRYGFHRDELYFVEAGRHLAWGFVDQPPLTPLLARAQVWLFGDSPAALRVLPALVSAGGVLLAAAIAGEMGGARRSRIVAAGAIAGAGFVLGVGHLLATATFDFAFWLVLIWIATRLLRTESTRWWLGYGAVAGAALWNKHLVVLLTVAFVAGLVIDRRWKLLRTGWLLAGAGVATLIALPNLVWQAANDWPQLEMARALSERLATENRSLLFPLQLILLGPFLVPLAVAGARWMTGNRPGHRFRPLLWSYAAALVLTFATAGRPYYPLALAAGLVIAGAAAVEPRLGGAKSDERRLVGAGLAWLIAVLLIANATVGVVLGLPVMPLERVADSPLIEVNETTVESVGWPRLAEIVASVANQLPESERERVVIVTGSYGEAGALDRYGPALGLPQPYSGHNSYWHWRQPRDDGAPVIAVRMDRGFLSRHFDSCALADTIDNEYHVSNEAQGQPVWLCRGLRGTWDEVWPDFRHYS